jgi:hypothetical protein
MKQKNSNKLSLSKKTVSKLNEAAMRQANGGTSYYITMVATGCNTTSVLSECLDPSIVYSVSCSDLSLRDC